MRIHLNQEEIYQAIKEFIEATGVPLTGKDVTVHLTAGRGANGSHKAQVEIAKPSTEKVVDDRDNAKAIEPEEEQQAIPFFTEEAED